MISPSRFFAIQTTKASNPNGIGGVPTLTPELAALYCQGMPEHHYLAGRLRWATDMSGMYKLEVKLYVESTNIMLRENWRINKKDLHKQLLRKMCRMAVAEIYTPSRFLSSKHKAAYLGVTDNQWKKTWRKRYEAIYNEINEWTNDAWRHIKKQLAKDSIENA